MPDYQYRASLLVHGKKPTNDVIDSLELIPLASDESDWQGEIRYLPL